MKIIFASQNLHKISEFKALLSDTGIELLSLRDIDISDDIDETGSTYEENALIKAKTIAQRTGEITISDDSGLEIAALNNQPGVYSARFMGHDTSYELKNQALIDQLKDKDNRDACFICAIAIADKTGTWCCRGVVNGIIAPEVQGKGFGYDPIFIPEGYQDSFGVLDISIKNRISHRAKALAQAKQAIVKRYL